MTLIDEVSEHESHEANHDKPAKLSEIQSEKINSDSYEKPSGESQDIEQSICEENKS